MGPESASTTRGLEVVSRPERSVALVTDPEASKRPMLELMAAGVPILTAELRARLASRLPIPVAVGREFAGAVLDDADPVMRLSVASRRKVWRDQSAIVRAQALLDLLQIHGAGGSWEVGVLLLSNKPNLVLAAVEMVLAQRNVNVFPVIGLHGDTAEFTEVQACIAGTAGGKTTSDPQLCCRAHARRRHESRRTIVLVSNPRQDG